jgi:molybdopterin-containing oxidoreductase family membrane subunit
VIDEKNLKLEEDSILFEPIRKTGKPFYYTLFILVAVILWAVTAYLYQYRHGLGVTGLARPIFWGVYITNFVFFIGISHAGTLISAILRLAKAEWRRAITRSAEVITVLVLFFGVGNILIDLGRPDRMFNIIRYAQFRSPLLWDVSSITVYLTASSVYLFLPLIPDIALLRDHAGKWQWFYRIFALGWRGTERQHHLLERGIAVMAILVIPIAVSVHTVVSFVFAMTIQPMWHSAIFGPYYRCSHCGHERHSESLSSRRLFEACSLQ